MSNPILNGVGHSQIMQRVSQMKQTMQWMKAMSNPKEMVNQMLKNNPQASEIQKLIDQNGGDVEKTFRQRAKEMGVDPEEIIKALL